MTDAVRALAGDLNAYAAEGGCLTVLVDEPMSRHTSFHIGGPAGLYLVPGCRDALIRVLTAARERGVRTYLLGNGTNVLFDDEGYDGAVVSLTGMDHIAVGEDGLVTAEAGASLSSVCKSARDAGLTGLEFAFGIPGSVGGAVVMNAGAYGGETAQVLEASEYLDPRTMETGRLTLGEHSFGYRDSVYRHTDRIVLSASFRLKPGNREDIAAAMSDYASRRVSKQPLEYPSAGSVFKRPVGHFVGQMVEESGLKGYRIGGAEVSEKHAGFIVNRGSATCRDVLALVEHIRETVRKNYGVELECEIIHVS